jgi:ATPases with chaperone activity, ATP-binding subunit
MLGTAFLGYKYAVRLVEDIRCNQIEFSPEAKVLIAAARSEAARDGFLEVGSERLLLAAVLLSDSPVPKLLLQYGLTFTAMHKEIRTLVGTNDPLTVTNQSYSPRAAVILDNAKKLASKMGSLYATPAHILLALTEDGEGIGCQILDNLKVDRRSLIKELRRLDEQTALLGP